MSKISKIIYEDVLYVLKVKEEPKWHLLELNNLMKFVRGWKLKKVINWILIFVYKIFVDDADYWGSYILLMLMNWVDDYESLSGL